MRSAALLLALTACSSAPRIPPQRIVSDNPCTDAILHDVAAPAQIGAISRYSQDVRATSVPLDWAMRQPAISGTAEEIIAARPRLYITSAPINPVTQAAVRRAGIPVLALPVPTSIAQSASQVRTVARAIGSNAAGEAVVVGINNIAALQQAQDERTGSVSFSALIYQGGGLILGAGTLADDELRAAGLRNAARDFSAQPWDVVPLERVIMHPPDIILVSPQAIGEETRGLSALKQVMKAAGRHIRVAAFDPRLTYCGAGSIPRAVARLRAIASAP